MIILKKKNSVIYLCGNKVVPNPKRAVKKRMKAKLLPIVDTVSVVKDGHPNSKDVVKASANLEGVFCPVQPRIPGHCNGEIVIRQQKPKKFPTDWSVDQEI
jgi:hypothetical protein